MKTLELPNFKTYEEEAAYWDNLDTGEFMEDDGEWIHFESRLPQRYRVTILPDTALALMGMAHQQGVTVETLVNVMLVQHLQHIKPIPSPQLEAIAA